MGKLNDRIVLCLSSALAAIYIYTIHLKRSSPFREHGTLYQEKQNNEDKKKNQLECLPS